MIICHADVLSKNDSVVDSVSDDERSSKMELELKAVLNEEAKTKLTEKREPSFYGGKPTGHNTEYYIGRTRVMIRQGVVHSEVPVLGPMSEEIKPYIAGFFAEGTIHEDILGITRDKGKYALPGEEDREDRQTTGTVEFLMRGTSKVICYGSDREKVLDLYNLIRTGKVRPYEEADVPQGGMSRKEIELELQFLKDHRTGLEAENEMLRSHLKQAQESENYFKAALRSAEGELVEVRAELEKSREGAEFQAKVLRAKMEESNQAHEKNDRLRLLARSIENRSPLPLVLRKVVAKQINEILDRE
jgi:hypothetical protein